MIGVSCSGGPARISEVLERANRYGCVSLALTNNPESPAAKTAAYTYLVHTPEFPNANPGLRHYFASLTGLYLLAAKLGELTGCSKPGALEGMATAIVENTAAWAGEMDRINSQMLALSEAWKDIERFDYIGDDIQFASAFFMAAKIVEVTGCMTATDDSEDWCHVGFFQRDPHSIGTVVAADRYANDWSRLRETLSQAAGILCTTFYDPKGHEDIIEDFDRIWPARLDFQSTGDPWKIAAESKASVAGQSMDFIVEEGALKLGASQGIFFGEYVAGQQRTYAVKVLGL